MNPENPLIQLDAVATVDSGSRSTSDSSSPEVQVAKPLALHNLLVPDGGLDGGPIKRSASEGGSLNLLAMEATRRMPEARTESMYSSPSHHRRHFPLTPDSSFSGMRGISGQGLSASYSSGSSNSLRPRMTRTHTVDTPTINKYEGEEYDMVNQYKVLDIIGHGSYGIVHKVTDSNERIFAMKMVGKRRLRKKSLAFPARGPRGMKQTKDPLEGIRKEIAILKKLTHPNVVHLVEVLDDPNEDELILVFEYIHNGAVMESISPKHRMSEEKARHHFINLILGLEYLHAHKVIHRDIKPENLLLDDDNTLKIADFGVSEQWTADTSDVQLHKSAGTPAFTAPEALDPANPYFGGKGLDIWAAGVTLYCFVFGKVPFVGKGIADLHEKITKQDVQFPDDMPISPDLCDLISRLLEKNPDDRISILGIREHPWVKGGSSPLPSVEENCRDEIDVTEEDMKQAVKPFRTPIHILVMIKNMARKKTLRNPYSLGIAKSPTTSPRSSISSEGHTAQNRRGIYAKEGNKSAIDDSPPSSQ